MRVARWPRSARQISALTRRSSAARSRSSGTSGGVTGGNRSALARSRSAQASIETGVRARERDPEAELGKLDADLRSGGAQIRCAERLPVALEQSQTGAQRPLRAGAIAAVQSQERLHVPGLDPVGNRTAAQEHRAAGELPPGHAW